jgi:hypothetical protein
MKGFILSLTILSSVLVFASSSKSIQCENGELNLFLKSNQDSTYDIGHRYFSHWEGEDRVYKKETIYKKLNCLFPDINDLLIFYCFKKNEGDLIGYLNVFIETKISKRATSRDEVIESKTVNLVEVINDYDIVKSNKVVLILDENLKCINKF